MMPVGAVSSVGRALALHAKGHRFESCTAHSPIHFALARNRTSNSGLEVRSYIHLTTRACRGYLDRVAVLRRAVNA